MKTKSILFLICLGGLLNSCGKEKEDPGNTPAQFSFTGKVQKGPFITGTTITLNELNGNLGQTGKAFTTTITGDDGSFSLNNIELNTSLCLLTANGFYFNELYGELSPATLSLQAISDLSKKELVNINVLTHMIKGRLETLVAGGKTFQQAKEQAQTELLNFLGVTETFNMDFDKLDISQNSEYNAVLLSFSVILQRYTNFLNEYPLLTAELTQLIANLSADFTPDGEITSQKLIDTLMYNISRHNLIDIRRNIESRYASLGQMDTIPDFEKYIAIFQEKYNQNLVTEFIYPDSASPDPQVFPNSMVPNLLVKTDTIYKAYNATPLCIAAIIPLHSTLTIKFISPNNNSNYIMGGPVSGWKVIGNYPESFTLISQRENQLMSLLFHLNNPGEATVEYYENNSVTPTFTKKIRWAGQ